MYWLHISVLAALPAVLSPETNHSADQRVPSLTRAISPPFIVTSSAANTFTVTTTHLVGSQKRKARKQCITRLDPENVRTSRGKLRDLDFILLVFRGGNWNAFDTCTYCKIQFSISCFKVLYMRIVQAKPILMLLASHLITCYWSYSLAALHQVSFEQPS
jgi:hypothetical protein